MKQNKKTAASSANTGSSLNGNITSQGEASVNDYTLSGFVSQYLHHGAENAIRPEALMKNDMASASDVLALIGNSPLSLLFLIMLEFI